MSDRVSLNFASEEGGRSHDDGGGELGLPVRLYDPALFRKAVGEDADDAFLGPEDERPALPSLTIEEEVRARRLRRILQDPRGPDRPALNGSPAMAARLVSATASMKHFDAVTGIVERSVRQSAFTGRPLRMPPVLMVSPPGLGKTYYCRQVAQALRTTCIPIAINGTSDRGRLGGLSPLWRGADMGKIAKGLLVASATAAPLFLLDEIDKPPALVAGENTLDVLLSALEPENAATFVDEYIDVPIDLRSALWVASANTTSTIPPPLLDRMLVVEVPSPDRTGALILADAVAGGVLAQSGLASVADDALVALLDLSPRRMRRVLELACGFAASGGRSVVTCDDVRAAMRLADRNRPFRIGFLAGPGSDR